MKKLGKAKPLHIEENEETEDLGMIPIDLSFRGLKSRK